VGRKLIARGGGGGLYPDADSSDLKEKGRETTGGRLHGFKGRACGIKLGINIGDKKIN